MSARTLLLHGTVVALAMLSPAAAKTLSVKVDARSGPWNPGISRNPKFGIGDWRPAKVVIDQTFRPGIKVTFKAQGSTTTFEENLRPIGPDGDPRLCRDFGVTDWPSRYLAKRLCLNGLVGAFITGDGVVIGKPFAIGSQATAVVPEGASALSLGINDDRFVDNAGELTVDINIPEASVIVEEGHETK